VHNAWLRTLEDGIYTYDIAKDRPSGGTKEFAQAVVERLGKVPETLPAVDYTKAQERKVAPVAKVTVRPEPKRDLNGVDVFLYNKPLSAQELGQKLEALAGPEFQLTMISNRGVKVYPGGYPETFTVDHWRCRFERPEGRDAVSHQDIRSLLGRIEGAGLEWIKLENLYLFDGERAYSLDQGQ